MTFFPGSHIYAPSKKRRRTILNRLSYYRYHIFYFPLLGACWGTYLWWLFTLECK